MKYNSSEMNEAYEQGFNDCSMKQKKKVAELKKKSIDGKDVFVLSDYAIEIGDNEDANFNDYILIPKNKINEIFGNEEVKK